MNSKPAKRDRLSGKLGIADTVRSYTRQGDVQYWYRLFIFIVIMLNHRGSIVLAICELSDRANSKRLEPRSYLTIFCAY